MSVAPMIRRLIADETGQDLVEYALITAIFGIAGVLVFESIRTKMGDAYVDWGQEIQDNWIPDPPAGP